MQREICSLQLSDDLPVPVGSVGGRCWWLLNLVRHWAFKRVCSSFSLRAELLPGVPTAGRTATCQQEHTCEASSELIEAVRCWLSPAGSSFFWLLAIRYGRLLPTVHRPPFPWSKRVEEEKEGNISLLKFWGGENFSGTELLGKQEFCDLSWLLVFNWKWMALYMRLFHILTHSTDQYLLCAVHLLSANL